MSLQQVIHKLPEIRDWVDRTLAAHRTETRSAASFKFARLPKYFPAIFLETSFVVLIPTVPVVPLASVFGLTELQSFEKSAFDAMTYRNTYFVREDKWAEESLHFHELVHVAQWQHLGVDGFITAYADGMTQHGYLNNPLEAMAREFQEYFDRDGEPMDIRAVVRKRLPKPSF